jgi:PPK2 family polyphosphate:nucleotide phosphotransferase
MKREKRVEDARRLTRPYRIEDGSKFRLRDFDPGDTGDLERDDKPRARKLLERGVEAMARLQDMLYAQNQWSVLLVFQALDAAGKDSMIRHVFSGVNPQGCQVASFKAPSLEELDHDFLWRCQKQLPERGRIGIFNRSYYEEVLVVRVHPEFLDKQRLPQRLVGKDLWRQRHHSIAEFERHLGRNGTVVRKFFLNVSREEQKRRFLDRIEDPAKNWKFSSVDVAERARWDAYRKAYEETIRATATKEAPWYVIPADHKWYARIVVAAAIVETLDSLGVAYPKFDGAHRAELETARKQLLAER